MSQPIVIDFEERAFSTSGPRLMGAQSAAEGFLQAYFKYSGETEFHARVMNRASADAFARAARNFVPEAKVHAYGAFDHAGMQRVGAVYHGDPMLPKLAWERRRFGDAAYSLFGVTHTTCTAAVLDTFGDYLIAPLHEWDAVVCTSTSVRSTVETILAEQSEYLASRFGVPVCAKLQLPVIPLGVDCDRFERSDRTAVRARRRASLGIGEADFAFLFLGRLSYHAKANPFPMFRALEETALKTGKKLHLMLVGWFANDVLETNFREAAARYSPHVKLHVLDGRDPAVRDEIWYAADAFTSFSDNIQETFGLTPIEAMAAGLPSVISDWDGYRDTVRHEIDGFRVPTLMPAAPHGEELIRRHEFEIDTYDRYIGNAALCTAIDLPAAIAACTALVEQPALRTRLGEAARLRARERFDWRVVLAAYREVWREADERRERAGTIAATRGGNPLRPDPFALFADYPTVQLASAMLVRTAPLIDSRVFEDPILRFDNGGFLLLPRESLDFLLTQAKKPIAIGELLRLLPVERNSTAMRSLGWLLKVGVLECVDRPAVTNDRTP